MKKTISLLFPILFLFACGYSNLENNIETPPTQFYPPISFYQFSPSLQNIINDFSSNIFLAVLEEREENPFVSPLSLYYALAMVALGAQNETAEEFNELLGMEANKLAPYLWQIKNGLMNTNGDTYLHLANSVWFDKELPINYEFSQKIKRYFGELPFSRDFRNELTVHEINSWVYENTMGLIQEILDSISQDTVMYLINTLYFLGVWQNRMETTNRNFNLANSTSINASFIQTTDWIYHTVNENYKAVKLSYNDNQTFMLLISPIDETEVRRLNFNLENILNSLQRSMIEVALPEFDKSFNITLNSILQSMGLNLAFDEHSADLFGLIEQGVGFTDNPFISRVFQDTRIIVDRRGTEAAAVTTVEIWAESLNVSEKSLIFDRPFIYIIFCEYIGLPLFMGVLDRPL
ncbi:MAG: hypothetical protein FWF50_00635 [Defluviitaleaceae bacterium]|nr:hypothetical protein [Defluviitaleaceae bacterium]